MSVLTYKSKVGKDVSVSQDKSTEKKISRINDELESKESKNDNLKLRTLSSDINSLREMTTSHKVNITCMVKEKLSDELNKDKPSKEETNEIDNLSKNEEVFRTTRELPFVQPDLGLEIETLNNYPLCNSYDLIAKDLRHLSDQHISFDSSNELSIESVSLIKELEERIQSTIPNLSNDQDFIRKFGEANYFIEKNISYLKGYVSYVRAKTHDFKGKERITLSYIFKKSKVSFSEFLSWEGFNLLDLNNPELIQDDRYLVEEDYRYIARYGAFNFLLVRNTYKRSFWSNSIRRNGNSFLLLQKSCEGLVTPMRMFTFFLFQLVCNLNEVWWPCKKESPLFEPWGNLWKNFKITGCLLGLILKGWLVEKKDNVKSFIRRRIGRRNYVRISESLVSLKDTSGVCWEAYLETEFAKVFGFFRHYEKLDKHLRIRAKNSHSNSAKSALSLVFDACSHKVLWGVILSLWMWYFPVGTIYQLNLWICVLNLDPSICIGYGIMLLHAVTAGALLDREHKKRALQVEDKYKDRLTSLSNVKSHDSTMDSLKTSLASWMFNCYK